MNTQATPSSATHGRVICVAPGDITSTTEGAFMALIRSSIQQAGSNWHTLGLDLHNARMIDSKGLNVLVSLIKEMKTAGKNVQLIAPQTAVRRVLGFTRIDKHAEVVES